MTKSAIPAVTSRPTMKNHVICRAFVARLPLGGTAQLLTYSRGEAVLT